MKVSIIVRTKNEESWIGLCLSAIKDQITDRSTEVEVVLVDSGSNDLTIEKAKSFLPDITVVLIENYRPGFALNKGIEKSCGDIIVCLSSHCIPANEYWLENLIEPLQRAEVVAVYGRQIPYPSSGAFDKRDLWISFGLDAVDQKLDIFFHNANSAIRKSDWTRVPFDSDVKNLEDRLWASQVLTPGRIIHYTPESVVYHHHGIHQAGDLKRAEGVVKVMEEIHENDPQYHNFRDTSKDLTKLLLIPLSIKHGDEDLHSLRNYNEYLKDIKNDWEIIALPSNDEQYSECEYLKIRSLYFRNYSSIDGINPLAIDIKEAVKLLDGKKCFYDYIGLLDIRKKPVDKILLNNMLAKLWSSAADTVVLAKKEMRPILKPLNSPGRKTKKVLIPAGNWYLPENCNTEELYIADPTRIIISRPGVLREGKFFGEKVTVVEEEC